MILQRITIWQPFDCKEEHIRNFYYFIELQGSQHHHSEMGILYNSLYTRNTLQEGQLDIQLRQTSSVCSCNFSIFNGDFSFDELISKTSSIDLDDFAHSKTLMIKKLVRNQFTLNTKK